MPSTLRCPGGLEWVLYGFFDGNRPEDLNLFHSLTCKNNVILDYYGV